jgi:hypothetical protein
MTGSHHSPSGLAAAYFDAWKSNDIDRVRPILHDDVTFDGALGSTRGVEETLAGLGRMFLHELASYPILLSPRERNPWAREQVDAMFAAAGAELVLGPDYGSLREAVAMIAGSQAWMVTRGSVAAQESSALLMSAPLTDPTAVGRVSLAWRTLDAGPVTRALVAVVSALRREGSLEPPAGVHQS